MAKEPAAIYPELKGKSVFVTGGGSGIGASLTEAFLQQGAQVAFVQRSPADEFRFEMNERYNRMPLFLECDVTDIPALRLAIEAAGRAHGSP